MTLRKIIISLLYLLPVQGLLAQQYMTDMQLKAYAARTAGLDTTAVFRSELSQYGRERAVSLQLQDLLSDGSVADAYQRMQIRGELRMVLMLEIRRSVLQHASDREIRACEALMDSVAHMIAAGIPFESLVARYSDHCDTLCVNRMQMTTELENAIKGLSVGQTSQPFWTPAGMHIVKIVAEQSLSQDEYRRLLASERHPTERAVSRNVELLKQLHGFRQNDTAVAQLMRDDLQDDTELFSLDGQSYTVAQFNGFAQAYVAGRQRQYAAFVQKSVLDCGNNHLQSDAQLQTVVEQHADSLLADAITERMVTQRAHNDEQGLQNYFDKHKKEYNWASPRFRGIVVHAADKKTAKRVRKALSKLPEADWQDALRLMFDERTRSRFIVTEGSFAQGDNPYVDERYFGGQYVAAPEGFKATQLLGTLQQGPESLDEIRSRVVADYERQLEADWLKQLRQR